jgi:ATP-dependent DNA helicase PIF1
MTGYAAMLLDCASTTLHSWGGLAIEEIPFEEQLAKIKKNHRSLSNWRTTDCLVIDEVSMLPDWLFQRLDDIGRSVRSGRSHLPFGGLQVLLFGDFFQLPPVRGQFCFTHPAWKLYFPETQCVVFQKIFRQKDASYVHLLNQIRYGQIDKEGYDMLASRVCTHDQAALVTHIFATRRQVDELNQNMFDQIDEPTYRFEAVVVRDCTQYRDGSNKALSREEIARSHSLSDFQVQYEIDNLLKQSSKASLELKKGSLVMCTSNLDMTRGICNGSQGIVESIDNNGPIVRFDNQLLLRIPVVYRHSVRYPTIAVGQLPLCLAWAITIHKVQGASLESAQMDLGRDIFECGQTYVALSRIRNLQGLYLSSFDPSRIQANPLVVAFDESLARLPEDTLDSAVDQSIEETLIYIDRKNMRFTTSAASAAIDSHTKSILSFFKKQKR